MLNLLQNFANKMQIVPFFLKKMAIQACQQKKEKLKNKNMEDK